MINTQKTQAQIRISLLANRAAPSPVLGQALGQYGINIMQFCKEFNNRTKNIKENVLVPILVQIYNHNHFEIKIKLPTTSYLFKNTGQFTKGSLMAKKLFLQDKYISLREIYHLAILKKCDTSMNNIELKSICKMLIASAKSMGLSIKKN